MTVEPLVLWSVAILVTAFIVARYFRAFRRRVRAEEERHAEAVELGINRPSAQFPDIDPLRCVGCGSCVLACPEGDVLGVVAGTARVINGLRCVGHARCEEACPTGAIVVGMGDLSDREDVPRLNEALETTVPGVFVAGELGGLSLVRNAVLQGRQVAETVASRAGADGEALDLVIVGAGPAGISAGLQAREQGLDFVILEREADLGGSLLHYPRRKMVLTRPVSLSPWGELSREEYSKEDLLEMFQDAVDRFELPIAFASPVDAIERRDGMLAVRAAGEERLTRTVLLALGRRGTPRKLGVPGEELSKVMYRLIDAATYENERILIVGGGDSAAEAALALARQPGNEVTLSYRRDRIVRIKKKNQDALDEALASGAIRPLFSSNVSEILEDSVRLTVQKEGGEETVEIGNDFVFVFAGGVPPTRFLQSVGVEMGGESSRAIPA